MDRGNGVVDFGGSGPLIVVLHGLMGRATTWWSVAQWLTRYGHVVGPDARGHGRARRGGPWRTEDFVDDVAELVTELGEGPAVLIGHSMGGLHAWALAATRPDLARAVVVEDMAPDQRGRTVDAWRAYFDSWPVPFQSIAHVRRFFGATGDYFAECVEERADGYHLIADLADLYEIAAEWGRRDYWALVAGVRCPLLVIEAGNTAMPPGQQAELAARVPGGRHVVVPSAGHVVHDDAPEEYRGAVEAFLSKVLGR
ncbi:Pimeloyl-ACP methyl ester carboxylesterase [Amycolatopsis arida]|uniref:Pimeloyl-ACP methyl ester carboxylesterase n=1 Tax=Amycolatopsis arida TaxID=587909 RepID=A0A1I5R5P5_9PSEU|nr:alpha/beta hydrolase [Amycolatopsis arida]TDX99075.1 pimeloyl-ACP methyl ester carboxylesterase [Amycolatopsis arida]SFP53386.1 Pimeloyl-ACP methyl ester carboxylesterase [Amycolatopsis arida]